MDDLLDLDAGAARDLNTLSSSTQSMARVLEMIQLRVWRENSAPVKSVYKSAVVAVDPLPYAHGLPRCEKLKKQQSRAHVFSRFNALDASYP